MKKSRFTDSQIFAILKQAESGVPVSELCRQHGYLGTICPYVTTKQNVTLPHFFEIIRRIVAVRQGSYGINNGKQPSFLGFVPNCANDAHELNEL